MKRIVFIILLAFSFSVVVVTDAYSQKAKKRDKTEKLSESDSDFKKANKKKKKSVSEKEQTKEVEIIKCGRSFLFGVAINYSDSVTLTTNICEVDSISYYKQTKTPVGLGLYTESLNNYLIAQGKNGYLCSTFIFNTKKQAEKKLLSIRNRVTSKKQTALRAIGDFKYVYINTDNIFTNEFVNKSSGLSNDDDF
ncbi:MAG: hypothetical protein ACI4TS_03580 [Bacteroidaceae bacterium]